MNTRDNINKIFEQLAKTLKLPDFKLSDKGYASLTFDNTVPVSFDYFDKEGIMFIYAPVGSLKSLTVEKALSVCRMLLTANFLWNDTGGSTLSYEKETQTIVMVQKIETKNLTYEIMESTLEIFINFAEKWYKTLEGADKNNLDDYSAKSSDSADSQDQNSQANDPNQLKL